MVLGAHGVKVRTGARGEDALSRARGLLAAGGAEAALPELEAVTARGGGPEGARELRGRALVGVGRFEDALAELGGIRAGPGASDAWFARGEACRALGRDDEGRAAFEQAAAYALSEPPGEAVSDPAVLPLALERMGNADGAARALDMRLQSAPGHGSLLCVKALLSAKCGSTADAMGALEGAVATHPQRVLETLAEPALAEVAAGEHGQEFRRRAERERQRLLERLLASG
jgi:tetratricopeptide (TPR) repeat protein